MLASETVTFLEGGCAFVVGTVSTTGEPRAGRGWGATVLSGAGAGVDIRLLLDVDDAVAVEHLSTTGIIAVTGSDVRTLRSIQFKGTVLTLEPGTEEDRERAARFCDAFFGDVGAVDGTARSLLERLTPRDFLACLIRVTELYDQTPGPTAGAKIGEDGP